MSVLAAQVIPDVFSEIATLLLLAAGVAAVGAFLRQPLIVSFIAVGVLAGPSVLGWVTAKDEVDLLSRLGIVLLLFVVGLKLDLHVIRTMGPVALATGLGQVFFTSVVGYFLGLGLGLNSMAALYVAVALTFSSTIIIVKLLSDKGEVDALHGRIAIGFLIVQDIVVVLVMIGLTALGQAENAGSLGMEALAVLGKGALFLVLLGLLMRYVLTPLLHYLARSQELLILFSIAWAAALATAGAELGFSKEVGAFLAGVCLASTPYREVIGSRLVTLRDFLLLFFFIDLGARLDLGAIGGQVGPAIVLSLFVLIGNPLIVMVIMGAMGYRKRTSFLAGLTVAQISEFSLILGALGVTLGHLNAQIMGLITLVGLITISISSYMILYSHPLYGFLERWLGLFERKRTPREDILAGISETNGFAVILFGLGCFGSGIARELHRRGQKVLGVDFDPELARNASRNEYPMRYGDAEDPEFLATLPLNSVNWIVSAVADLRTNLNLLHSLRRCACKAEVAVTAHNQRDAARLRDAGASLILMPYADGAAEAVDRLFGEVSSSPLPTTDVR